VRTFLRLRVFVAAMAIGALAAFAATQLVDDDDHVSSQAVSTTTTRAQPTTEPTTTISPCPTEPTLSSTAPPEITQAVTSIAESARAGGSTASVSIWLDGYGEVGAFDPDRQLFPASNQKLLTAIGALTALGPNERLTTELRFTSDGALVVVAGGDPSLTGRGPHSLDALAAQVRTAGLTDIPGGLVIDESRHDSMRRAAGWQDWQVPAYAGSLSAFMVDRNRWRGDPAFLADPALANGDRLRQALVAHGVTVRGTTRYGTAPRARVVARLVSAPIATLLTDTLMRSDNMAAEELLKEAGRASAGTGSTAAGLVAARAELERHCVSLAGHDDDGSGLSRSNGRSAREWVAILRAVRTEPWFQTFLDALPVAGRSGTLAGRFRGAAAEGRVHAKTGTIIGGIALSGYGTTVGNRQFVFSVLVNGDQAGSAIGALDRLVNAVAAHPG
jgi:D-alanyl-D-alanine carboxypeptidase/D-alanyl-D-alanine-endopeptidase (penicillin-binding protein 4)